MVQKLPKNPSKIAQQPSQNLQKTYPKIIKKTSFFLGEVVIRMTNSKDIESQSHDVLLLPSWGSL